MRKAAAALWHDREDTELISTGAYVAREHRPKHAQLARCAEWVADLCKEAALAANYQEDIYVFVEEPLIGNNRKYSLGIAMTYGAVLSALDEVEDTYPLKIFGVNVSEWKKQVIGKGNAGKDDVKNYITVVNSRYAALCDGDQDQYDAACVGLYGVLVAARADSLLRS